MSNASGPCTFFQVYYKHSEYEVFQTETLREGLDQVLRTHESLKIRTLTDEDLSDYSFRLGCEKLRNEAGWGLVAVVIGSKLIQTPYHRYG